MKKTIFLSCFCLYFLQANCCKVLIKISSSDCQVCYNYVLNINQVPDTYEKILLLESSEKKEMSKIFKDFRHFPVNIKVVFSDSFYNKFDKTINSEFYVLSESNEIIYKNNLTQTGSAAEMEKIKKILIDRSLSEPDKTIIADIDKIEKYVLQYNSNKLYLTNFYNKDLYEYSQNHTGWQRKEITLSDSVVEQFLRKKYPADKNAYKEFSLLAHDTSNPIEEPNRRILSSTFSGDTIISYFIASYVDVKGKDKYIRPSTGVVRFVKGAVFDVLPAMEPPDPYIFNRNMCYYDGRYYFTLFRKENSKAENYYIGCWEKKMGLLKFREPLPFKTAIMLDKYNLTTEVVGSGGYMVCCLLPVIYDIRQKTNFLLPATIPTNDYPGISQGRSHPVFYICDIRSTLQDILRIIAQVNGIYKMYTINTKDKKLLQERELFSLTESENIGTVVFQNAEVVYYTDISGRCIKQRLIRN